MSAPRGVRREPAHRLDAARPSRQRAERLDPAAKKSLNELAGPCTFGVRPRAYSMIDVGARRRSSARAARAEGAARGARARGVGPRAPAPHEIPHIDRDEASLLIDGLLSRVARSHGALDVAIGERLAVLAAGDRVLRLGYSSIGDYALERLGIAFGTAKARPQGAGDPLVGARGSRGRVGRTREARHGPGARGGGPRARAGPGSRGGAMGADLRLDRARGPGEARRGEQADGLVLDRKIEQGGRA